MANRENKKRPDENKFISPLNDDVVKAIFGNQKNIHNAEALLKPIIGIPPGDYAGMRVVPPTLFRRWQKDKEGILDIRYVVKSDKTIHVEIQINPFKAMIPRTLYYQGRMVSDQIHSGEDFDRIHQVISVIILNYNLLPGKDHISVFEFRNVKTGEPFTDLQRIVIIELRKLPREDDGTAIWPYLRFFICKSEEEMTMLVTSHPEVRGAVKEYRRLTLFEEIRRNIDDMNDARRVRKAREDYVREEGYNRAAAEYQGQLSARDERIRQLEEENRRLRGE
ncbi:MAG: Rpn family recombination-promoting nuclease/putative transposase [Spirochaetaceae bacterium]|jgi:predicted transposase/invertase (TIGR01784 family)|nr:Rpn family recombination-promoting nuclease/putative transposase [Spirochaetaceae bacterium]